jgi:hypothetical protein
MPARGGFPTARAINRDPVRMHPNTLDVDGVERKGRVPATGKRFSRVRGATIAEFTNGKISRNADYGMPRPS